MTLTEGFQPATEQWNAFALALAAPLGPFAQVHLAPRFPPALLNAALATYLPLKEDELLLAIFDRGGQTAQCRFGLTTRRIYWTDIDQDREPSSAARSIRTNRSQAVRLVLRIADYADLPDKIEVDATPHGSFGIALAGGVTIDLGQIDGKLASALAHYLETMRDAARAGRRARRPDRSRARRAGRSALPSVARVTAQGARSVRICRNSVLRFSRRRPGRS